MNANDPLVAATEASKQYGLGTAKVVAVHDATCEVFAGQQIALIGPSGSGKSSLLNLLAGLETPTSGTVTWPALGPRESLRPQLVAVVFQTPSLMAPLDVLENVAFPLLLAGHSQVLARARAIAALERLDLSDLAAKLPEELSGGQAQRVAAARALAMEARIIFADEPTGQLDEETAERVIGLVMRASQETGAALVVSTHDERVANRLAIRWDMGDGTLRTTAQSNSQTNLDGLNFQPEGH